MDTIDAQTRAGLSFADWQSRGPAAAARELHRRLAALPDRLRRAAVAWLRPEAELAGALADGTGPLRGLPYGLKDLFDLAGAPTVAGSSFLPEVRPAPTRDCLLVRRLAGLGATCAAKTHLVEFASGLTGENIHHGDCPNPLALDRLTGGSSSGSVALVAAGVVPFAIGTDTGGSVRVPAAWCGLYGFRLTPGDPFIRDCFPLSATCDTAGWFTSRPGDLATLWRSLVPAGPAAPARAPRGCHLVLPDLVSGFDDATAEACARAAADLCPPADRAVREQLLADWREARPTYSTLSMREAFTVHREWMQPFRERYDPVIWQRYAEAGSWPEERIAAAHAAKDAIRAAWDRFFASYDFLVLPAVPRPAPRKDECTLELRLGLLTLTAPASVGGLPCLTLPVSVPFGLSAGLQVILPRADSPVVPWLLERHGAAPPAGA